MNINELKRLAGITNSQGNPMDSILLDRSKIITEPGTPEWFNAMFPVNNCQMPVGFRGRKNIRTNK